MANIVTGAMSSLIPKLGELLKEEYNLQTGVKERVRTLSLELEGAHAALRKVAQVPWDELDEQVKLWAREVRESSYDMEDVLDTFFVHVQGRDSPEHEHQKGSLKSLGKKMANLFMKSKARRKISVGVKDIMTHLDEVAKRCCRYKVDDIEARPTTTLTVDPRLAVMYNKVKNLIGINKSSSELISMLQTKHRGDVPDKKMKIVSIVGVGGLGKTTLAKAVFDELQGDFDHKAFVPVGRNPDLKKIIKAILIELDKERYMKFNFTQLDEIYQFINELRDFLLENKRFFIVVDDIWEVESWEKIKLAIDDDDNNCGGRIIVTTRKMDVATKASEVYELRPLSYDSSRELFYSRVSGDQGSHVDNQADEISDKILNKCGGIPLAIITMASLLVGKPRDRWSEIYKTIGFGSKDSKGAENAAMKILSFSYYDLPSHLRTCLLYLSAYPEDSVIRKRLLIWKWVAEGFILKEQGTWIFETGEGYFNDLVNRSLIQAVEEGDPPFEGIITGCRVHDIVLDLIRSMSHNENFFTVEDNDDQDTPLHGHVRRLAHLNGTMQHTHKADDFDVMRTVRSFSAQECGIESWVPLSSFTFLRVLAIEHCKLADGCHMRMKFVGKLLHLRYLSLSGTKIDRVPEEIGGLRFLETLDLTDSEVRETPSSSSLPTQLVCLRISFDFDANSDNRVDWIERMTSLEELYILDRFQWKELGCLRELRVLNAGVFDDDECEEHFVESVSHLDKLQHLSIKGVGRWVKWQAVGLALPRQLRYFCTRFVTFLKLPPCISPWGLPNLCHLDLNLEDMDEQDLKSLGGLPELRFLRLELNFSSSAAISNIIDDKNNAVYFPNLRHFKLADATVLFVANKEDNKSVSFHLLGSTYHECMGSAAASSNNDDENNKEEAEDANVGRKGAAAPRPRCFMPSLQELESRMRRHLRRYCDDSLGWEYLPSLREVQVDMWPQTDEADACVKVEEKLRSEADAHPNRPALRIRP
ncbi:hypothetical protein U9M48_000358 [Paspalum notatum var. saurae]|uniref:AAA+ ATPase domain-containing protein n=1 Tax=Paspalum notatum var. saurae TaxID=547442 RepID=A0AAQ3PK50_PASNO